MKRIQEFLLIGHGLLKLDLPSGAKILTVKVDSGFPALYAEADPGAAKETRCFETFITGQDIREDMGTDRKYIGTVQIPLSAKMRRHVIHVYERLN